MTAIFYLSELMSTTAIAVVCFTITTGNALSMKMRHTMPFERPIIRDSFFGGPLTTLMCLILASMIHSRTRMPVKARSWIFLSKIRIK